MSFLSNFIIKKNDDRYVKYLFFLVYLAGALITLLSSFLDKYIGHTSQLFIMIFLMLFYLFQVSRIKHQGDRFIVDEQLGDTFYQLGFLFTITALAVTLLFIEDDEVGKILTKFGFAVVTTLVGLVGRILLSQFRMDIDQLEEDAELQISDAVRRLKTQLDMSVDLLYQQSQNMTRNADKTLRESNASLKAFTEENSKILKDSSENSQKVIEEFNSRVSEISEKLSTIKIPTTNFDGFESSVNKFVTSLNDLEKGVKESNAKNELLETAKSFKSLSKSIDNQSNLLNNEFVTTKETLQGLSENLVNVAKFISENLKK
jgi:hypothetical protein